jgi:hypothetical protein
LPRGFRSQFARQLQREVAAERVPGDGKTRQAIPGNQLPEHEERVGGQAGVVQPRRQVLGAAAVALVEQDDVELT